MVKCNPGRQHGSHCLFFGGGGGWGGISISFFDYFLRELGSYILRDTPKPWQLKARGPKPTIKQLRRGP